MQPDSWIRQHVKDKILRTSGGHSFTHLNPLLESMDHGQLQDLWTLLKNIESDAKLQVLDMLHANRGSDIK